MALTAKSSFAKSSREEVETFRTSLSLLSDNAQLAVENLLVGLANGSEHMSPAEIRNFLEAYVPDVIDAYGSAAAGIAADYYANQRDLAGVSGAFEPVLADTPPVGQIGGSLSWATSGLAEDVATVVNVAQVVGTLKQMTDRLVKLPARETVLLSSMGDPKRPRWARIPTGLVTCKFCTMLASRGAVYLTQESAGEMSRYHDHCDCAVAPIFPGAVLPDGYNPEHYLRLYREDGGASIDLSDRKTRHLTYSRADELNARAAAVKAEEAAQKAAQQTAEAEARATAEKAAEDAQRAAEEAAAKKAAALEKKWLGKPAPKAPKAPVKPVPGKPAPDAFDSWLQDAKDRYAAFAPGKKLENSNNWFQFKAATSGDETDALIAAQFLLDNKYLDAGQYATLRKIYEDAKIVSPGTQAAYEKALRSYRNLSTRHKRYLQEWREVNGVDGSVLKGMDGARDWSSHDEDQKWLKDNLPDLTKDANRDYLTTYTGSSYRPWNNALRKNADASTLPSSYKDETEKLDELFTRSTLPEDVYLRRGTNMDEFLFPTGERTMSVPPPDPKDLVGTVQVQHGYMSTSYGQSSAFSGNVSLLLRVPEGHGVAFAEPISNFRSEREMLLQRGTSLYIHRVENVNGVWQVEAEVVPEDFDPAGASPMPLSKD